MLFLFCGTYYFGGVFEVSSDIAAMTGHRHLERSDGTHLRASSHLDRSAAFFTGELYDELRNRSAPLAMPIPLPSFLRHRLDRPVEFV